MVKRGKESDIDNSKEKPKKITAKKRQEILIENFIGLQKAMTNMAIKFESLSDNIEKLLGVFEMSAKSYLQGGNEKDNKDMLGKINSLLDQNKTIAKGLVMMEEKLRSQHNQSTNQHPSQNNQIQNQIPSQMQSQKRPLPRI